MVEGNFDPVPCDGAPARGWVGGVPVRAASSVAYAMCRRDRFFNASARQHAIAPARS